MLPQVKHCVCGFDHEKEDFMAHKRWAWCILPLLLLPLALQAQNAFATRINYFNAIEQSDVLLLDMFFSIVDSGGRVIVDAPVEYVELQLSDGIRYAAEVSQPAVPMYIALVLDSSGSMGGANQQMREAAVESLSSAPDLAQFAVITFNDTPQPLQSFTPDANLTRATIDSVRSVDGAGTCLYDAMFSSVDLLAQQPRGRRAMIIFTDGMNQSRSGRGCGIVDARTVINHARQAQVPLYIVGLQNTAGELNQNELNQIASETNAFAAFGSTANLGQLFGNMMESLGNQLYVQIPVYPRAGAYTGTLVPFFDTHAQAGSAVIQFNSSRDYSLPFQFTNLPRVRYIAERDVIVVERFQAIGVENLGKLTIEVNDENGFTILSEELTTLPTEYIIPGGQLAPGDDYTVSIDAFDTTSRPLIGEPITLDFRYNRVTEAPAEVSITVLSAALTADKSSVQINLDTTGADQISFLRIFVIDSRQNLTLPPIEGYRYEGAQQQINIPTNNLSPGGEYRIEIHAFGSNNQPLLPTPSEKPFVMPAAPLPLLTIVGVQQRPDTQFIDVTVEARNIELVNQIRVLLISKSTRQLVSEPPAIVGSPTMFPLDMGTLASGEYELQLIPLDANGSRLIEAPVIYEFGYQSPQPTTLETLSRVLRSPLVLSVLILLLGGVLFFFFQRIRDRKRSADTATNESEVMVRPRTVYQPPVDDLRQTTLMRDVLGTLVVISSQSFRPEYNRNLTRQIGNNTVYVIGRKEANVELSPTFFNFAQDKIVSGRHFELRYMPELEVFKLRDVGSDGKGSRMGTRVDGRLLKNEEIVLPKDRQVLIEIGKSIKMIFAAQGVHINPRAFHPNNTRDADDLEEFDDAQPKLKIEVIESNSFDKNYTVEVKQPTFELGAQVGLLKFAADKSVSSRHLRFQYLPDKNTFRVIDVGTRGGGSTYGTYVNDNFIQGEGVDLPNNDPVTIAMGHDVRLLVTVLQNN